MKWLPALTLALIFAGYYVLIAKDEAPLSSDRGAKQHQVRIVLLAPSYCDLLDALDACDRVVGISNHCKNPSLSKKERVGSFQSPSFEKILALDPDLVLAVPHVAANKTIEELEAQNIRVYAKQPDSLAQIKEINQEVARLLGHEAKGIELNRKLDQALIDAKAAIKDRLGPAPNNRALIAIADRPLVMAGKNTFISEIFEAIGFSNDAKDLSAPWPVWSMEQIISDPPSYLILPHGQKSAKLFESLFENAGFLKNRLPIKIIAPSKSILSSPSPSLVSDITYLVNFLLKNI